MSVALSPQMHDHMHNQFLIESEKGKVTLMFWDWLDIFLTGYRIFFLNL